MTRHKETAVGIKLPKEHLAEWVFRLCVLVGILYLSANYVSIKDYRADEVRKSSQEETKGKLLTEINMTLARIDERSKNDDTKLRVQKLEDVVHELDKKIP